MSDLTADGAKLLANGILSIGTKMEKLAAERDEYARPLRAKAHEILTARHAYGRTGMSPSILFEDDGTTDRIDEKGIYFHVSNGIDIHDDFDVKLTWEELGADTEAEAKAYEAHQKKKRLDEAAELRRRAAYIEAEAKKGEQS